MKIKALLMVVLIGIVVTACGKSGTETHENHASHQEHLKNGDIQETTASAEVLPQFLKKKSADIQAVYLLAAKHTSLLEWIPCYCGCGESAGHRSSLDCFVSRIDEDGSVVWDDHGTRCGTCLEIAATSIQMKADGRSLIQIRAYIDNQYKEGYSKPTDTKMPRV